MRKTPILVPIPILILFLLVPPYVLLRISNHQILLFAIVKKIANVG